MRDNRDRRYDTFVVRLWRDLVSHRVLRAEIEHVQSGLRSNRRWRAGRDEADDDAFAWISNQLGGDPTPDRGERECR